LIACSRPGVSTPIAKEALDRIGALYAIASEIRGKPPDKRRAARQARAGPLLDDLRAWLVATIRKSSKKSDAAGAIRYTLSRWQALCRYRDDGRGELDTLLNERCDALLLGVKSPIHRRRYRGRARCRHLCPDRRS
jgi:hypothetical protein